MKSLTIIHTTSRNQPGFFWFIDSLKAQMSPEDGNQIRIVGVDANLGGAGKPPEDRAVWMYPAKPTLWQGQHRVTSENWWAVSNARNTGICLADTEWVAFLDDRCVLSPTWLLAVREAMDGNYAVFGTYEKRHGMKVENGKIVEPGEVKGVDGRLPIYEARRGDQVAMPSFPSWAFGCSLALPLEWCLAVGGFEEALDGHSAEDTAFGAMLWNNGFPMRFDPRMGVIQDRTPELSGPHMRREDRGTSPQDKSHRALDLFHSARNTSNRHLLLQSRQAVQRGEPFPVLLGSREDWWDGAAINHDYLKR